MEQWDKFLDDIINNVPAPSRRRIQRAAPVLMLPAPAEVPCRCPLAKPSPAVLG